MQGKQPRLRDQVRAVIRVNHYSIRTEQTCWYWIRYFIRFHKMKHPQDMRPKNVNNFLTSIAVHRNVAATTQAQALNSLVFLYDKVLDQPLGEIGDVVRSKKPRKLPVVLTHEEAICIINQLQSPNKLIASRLYGSGLRITETCCLRVKDLDFQQQVITIRDGKGAKDRTTLMPASLMNPLKQHLNNIEKAWKERSEEFLHPVNGQCVKLPRLRASLPNELSPLKLRTGLVLNNPRFEEVLFLAHGGLFVQPGGDVFCPREGLFKTYSASAAVGDEAELLAVVFGRVAQDRVPQNVVGVSNFGGFGFFPHVADGLGVQSDVFLFQDLVHHFQAEGEVHGFVPKNILQLLTRAPHQAATLQGEDGAEAVVEPGAFKHGGEEQVGHDKFVQVVAVAQVQV